MELLKSRLLTVPHGFPTRAGGVSPAPWASLNAGTSTGDEPAAVRENLARLARAARCRGPIRLLTQVHGDLVVREGPEREGPPPEADGAWTGEAGVALGIRTADCLPVLLEDPVGRRVAAVHAGWRGVLAEIVVRAIDALVAEGSAPGDLRVAVGPGIGPCCFEVGGDLPERFGQAFGAGVVLAGAPGAQARLDLPAAVQVSLARRGVPVAQVEVLRHCTACDARFYSHRRDAGRTGRHCSFITAAFATRL